MTKLFKPSLYVKDDTFLAKMRELDGMEGGGGRRGDGMYFLAFYIITVLDDLN